MSTKYKTFCRAATYVAIFNSCFILFQIHTYACTLAEVFSILKIEKLKLEPDIATIIITSCLVYSKWIHVVFVMNANIRMVNYAHLTSVFSVIK